MEQADVMSRNNDTWDSKGIAIVCVSPLCFCMVCLLIVCVCVPRQGMFVSAPHCERHGFVRYVCCVSERQAACL